MSTGSICDDCGVEILYGFCNCSGLTARDKLIDRRQLAKAEHNEVVPHKKDPQWVRDRRRQSRG